ncbi:MAG: triose-phosphate isomerase [Dehalococcoidia bacterium]|nr:triose-phosphate isomerase [Dehalococcoidia bacterium]
MRRPFIAGNWKMNTNVNEAVSLIREMKDNLVSFSSVDRVLCPPFVSLYAANELVRGTDIALGAQNMYFKEKGAYTGEISPFMLKDLCKYIILGHSERRQIFFESSEMVNEKIKAALAVNLLPIMCIGETLAENEAGNTHKVLAGQVKAGLKGINASKMFIVAYEPIWAIGTGRAATAQQAGNIIKFIRDTIAETWDAETAEEVRILYGGSVTGANIAEFIKEPQIDGALVGGASLKAGEFVEIVRQCAAVKQ